MIFTLIMIIGWLIIISINCINAKNQLLKHSKYLMEVMDENSILKGAFRELSKDVYNIREDIEDSPESDPFREENFKQLMHKLDYLSKYLDKANITINRLEKTLEQNNIHYK